MNEKLTAYVLNELPPDERAELEAQMQTDPALREQADEMKAFCAMLTREMAGDESPALTPQQRVSVIRAFSDEAAEKKIVRPFWRHPALLVPAAIAACVAFAMLSVAPVARMSKSPVMSDSRAMRDVESRDEDSRGVQVAMRKIERNPSPTTPRPAPAAPEKPQLAAAAAPAPLPPAPPVADPSGAVGLQAPAIRSAGVVTSTAPPSNETALASANRRRLGTKPVTLSGGSLTLGQPERPADGTINSLPALNGRQTVDELSLTGTAGKSLALKEDVLFDFGTYDDGRIAGTMDKKKGAIAQVLQESDVSTLTLGGAGGIAVAGAGDDRKLAKAGDGLLALGDTSTFAGVVSSSSGPPVVSNGTLGGWATVGSTEWASCDLERTAGGAPGAGGGAGVPIPSGANNAYTGGTFVNSGTWNFANSSALGTSAGGTTVSSGAALELKGGIQLGEETSAGSSTSFGGLSGTGGFTLTGGGTVNIGSANLYNAYDPAVASASQPGTGSNSLRGTGLAGNGALRGTNAVSNVFGLDTDIDVNAVVSNPTPAADAKPEAQMVLHGGTLRFSGAGESASRGDRAGAPGLPGGGGATTTIRSGALLTGNASALGSTTVEFRENKGAATPGEAGKDAQIQLGGALTMSAGRTQTVTVTTIPSDTGTLTLNGNVTYGTSGAPLPAPLEGPGIVENLEGASLAPPSPIISNSVGRQSLVNSGGTNGASSFGRAPGDGDGYNKLQLGSASRTFSVGNSTAVSSATATEGKKAERTINLAGSTGVIDSSGTGALSFSNANGTASPPADAFAPAPATPVAGGFGDGGGLGNKTQELSNLTISSVTQDSGAMRQKEELVSGSGGIAKAGGNTLILSGANTYTGATTVNAGTLSVGNGSKAAQGPATGGDNAALAKDAADLMSESKVVTTSGRRAEVTVNRSTPGNTPIAPASIDGLLGLSALSSNATPAASAASATALQQLPRKPAAETLGALALADGIGDTSFVAQNGVGSPSTPAQGALRNLSGNNTWSGAVTIISGSTATFDLNGTTSNVGSLGTSGSGPVLPGHGSVTPATFAGTVALGAATLTSTPAPQDSRVTNSTSFELTPPVGAPASPAPLPLAFVGDAQTKENLGVTVLGTTAAGVPVAVADKPMVGAIGGNITINGSGSLTLTATPLPAVSQPLIDNPTPTWQPPAIAAEQERLRRLNAEEAARLDQLRRERLEEQKRLADLAKLRETSGETYTRIYENPFLFVEQQPLSTFSIDVDSASYANVRRFLNNGQRPPADAVRLEELINYFPYSYEGPSDGRPFGVMVDVAETPWQPLHRLVRVALKGREVKEEKERGPANFVFLVDVSGSMDSPDKLPLVQRSLEMLTRQLGASDRVAIVVYAGSSGLVLPSTPGTERDTILDAINRLQAGGSTNGAGGITQAYQEAAKNFVKGGVNRVILCTDGDFNVGISSPERLEKLIAEKAKSRIFLSVLGFGTGNLKDRTMETLADKGNGNYAYIDSLSEARKVLVEQMNGTLVTIAKDVKIQVEFNPTQVAAYRLLGYENRLMAKEDFNNDKKDAGEIGAGHTVTALYEVVPATVKFPDGRPMVDDLKYAQVPKSPAPAAEARPDARASREMMTVKLRYKQPEGDKSDLIEVPVMDKEAKLADSPKDFQFAASVAGFGMLLRDSRFAGELTWDMVRDLALRGKGEDALGYRGEFLQLIDKARGMSERRQ